MQTLLIVTPKCTLATLYILPPGEYADGTDRRTNRQTDARPLHYAFR